MLMNSFINAQENKDTWTDAEKNYYKVLHDFCHHIKSNNGYSRDLISEKFIEFDYVFKDTSIARIHCPIK